MPSSPLKAVSDSGDEASLLQERLSELDVMMDRGISFSGHERNCAFLNVPSGLEGGGRRFVTASAATGLDFEDDARSPAMVDWDRDGDLDLWITQRTGPMVRFLRNDLVTTGASWVSVRLRGQRCNRDGIGSQVEMTLSDGRRLLRTLKAGEGYLAQSSKWLHFGLGKARSIGELRVHWAGGGVETFTGVEPSGRFLLVEGSGKAAPGARQAPPGLPISGPVENVSSPGGAVRSVSVSRWPLPRLPYETFAREPAFVNPGRLGEGLTLVNLWATWCIPCREELRSLAARAEALRKAGISVVALSVDGVASEGATAVTTTDAPEAFYDRLKIPFPAGRATEELVRRMEVAYAGLFGLRWPLPVPTSVLLDGDGAVLAYYKGAVSVDVLLEDAVGIGDEFERRHDRALPFAGRWFRRPQPLDPLVLGLDLMEHGHAEDAYELAFRVPKLFRDRSAEFGKFLTWIGDELMKKGSSVGDALQAYRAAVEVEPENTIVLNNLAWQLAAHSDPEVRDGDEAVRWAEKAVALTERRDPAVLDTLAAAYAESGDSQRAIATATAAAALARQQGNRALWEGIQAGLAKYRRGRTAAE